MTAGPELKVVPLKGWSLATVELPTTFKVADPSDKAEEPEMMLAVAPWLKSNVRVPPLVTIVGPVKALVVLIVRVPEPFSIRPSGPEIPPVPERI